MEMGQYNNYYQNISVTFTRTDVGACTFATDDAVIIVKTSWTHQVRLFPTPNRSQYGNIFNVTL
jgi:hypothetical protein